MEASEVELAGLKAWPGLEEHWEPQYVLKFAEGLTKRANSLNPMESIVRIEETIEEGERYFKGKGIESVFRIPSFTDNQNLDAALEAKGYAKLDLSCVMGKEGQAREKGALEDLEVLSGDAWLRLYGSMCSMNSESMSIQSKILKQIGTDGFGLALSVEGKVASMGLGVVKDGYCGVFNLHTSESQRRRGFGAALMHGIESEGIARGATKGCFLQVVADNDAAIALYEKLGYEKMYHYWYRRKS